MRRPSQEEHHEKDDKDKKKNNYPKDTVEPVPELQGKAKLSNKKAMNMSFKRQDYIMNRKGQRKMPKDSQPDKKEVRKKKCNYQIPLTRENCNDNRNAKKHSIKTKKEK